MNPAYFQAAALASSTLIIPVAGGPGGGSEGTGYNFIVSTAAYTPPAGNAVNFTTS